MFSKEKIEIALRVYHQCGSLVETIRILGYPAKTTLCSWIANEKPKDTDNKLPKRINEHHPYKPSPEVKMEAIHRCFALRESVSAVSKEIGYSRNSIYTWRNKYNQGETFLHMNKKKTNQTADAEAAEQNKQPTVESLQKQIDEMQLQMTVIAEMLKEVIKKSPKRQSNKTKQQKQSNDS